MATIDVPDLVRDGTLLCIVSMSGGKDSTATALALKEAGVPFRMVFADTEWEAPETYAHLDHLRDAIGPIDVVGTPGGMVAKIRHRAGFPARMQRWCTRELKIEPIRAYHDNVESSEGVETVTVLGIRADESVSRAKMAAFEDEPAGERRWGGWVWRPILEWSVSNVIAIHHRHGVRMNPLYLRGHDRVGCYPCIFSRKGEIRLLADEAPDRIALIADLEAEVAATRQARNAESPGRYKHNQGSFFQSPGRSGFVPIEDVVRWSRTAPGGRQTMLLAPPPEGGCIRWGMCEPPTREGED